MTNPRLSTAVYYHRTNLGCTQEVHLFSFSACCMMYRGIDGGGTLGHGCYQMTSNMPTGRSVTARSTQCSFQLRSPTWMPASCSGMTRTYRSTWAAQTATHPQPPALEPAKGKDALYPGRNIVSTGKYTATRHAGKFHCYTRRHGSYTQLYSWTTHKGLHGDQRCSRASPVH